MLDIKVIRENPEKIQKSAKDKGIDVDIVHILEIDSKKRELDMKVQGLREERNKAARLQSPHAQAGGWQAKEQDIEKGKSLKVELERDENALKAVDEELQNWLLKIPNPAKADVKVGKDESGNEVVRKSGEPTKFDF